MGLCPLRGGDGGVPVPGGGVAVLVARLPFTLALFFPPSPRPPSSREGGDFKVIYARGFAPCIPGAEPARHLQNPPSGCPEWGFAPCGAGMVAFRYPAGGRGACPLAALARPAPGERTISNAEVPLPRSPLSLAAGTVQRKAFPSLLHRDAGILSQGICLAGSVSAAGGLMPGMQGAKPLA